MKLFKLAMWRMAVAMIGILTVWAAFFYMAMMEEVNDEVDDSLEDYAETLLIRSLSGEEMPSVSNGSNNQYYLYTVSGEYAARYPHISYHDEMVYIYEKEEYEPARVFIQIFQVDDGSYRELVVYTPTIEKQDLQRAMLGWIVFLYVLLLLAILLINAWVFRRNMKPLYVLLKWLDGYRLDTHSRPLVNPTRVTEFRTLNEAVLRSMERSEALYEQQKLFIGNASHEMQTPLAICRNRLEMLMEDDTLTEKQLEELSKTHQTLESLTRMNRSLLMLCKIENHQFVDVRSICLNEMLARYLDDYQEVYAYKQIHLSLEEQGRFCVDISESLAVVLLTNLLKNAFVHSEEGGEIRILFTESLFSISNEGGKPLDGDRIFERFYQGARKEGSTGLGLALVRSVCKASQLDISYTFSDNRHIFTVKRLIF
mgnify:CR=1 FL=1|jgi:two-component system sensor histidine kinase QseC